jgi:hypothetical protein
MKQVENRDNQSREVRTGVDMTETITTFVTFNMPPDVVDKFKTEWLKDAAFIARQPGQKGGTLYHRIGINEQVEFINVAHWENEGSMNAARDAVVIDRQQEGRNQASLFEDLRVSVSAENYVVEVPY